MTFFYLGNGLWPLSFAVKMQYAMEKTIVHIIMLSTLSLSHYINEICSWFRQSRYMQTLKYPLSWIHWSLGNQANDLYSTLSFGAVMNTLGKKLKIMRDFRRRCAFDFFLACCISLASSSFFFFKGFCAWNTQRSTGYLVPFTTCRKYFVATSWHSGKVGWNFQLMLINFVAPVRSTADRTLYRARKQDNTIIFFPFQTR